MTLKKFVLAAGMGILAVVPIVAIADGVNFNLKVGDDNEAHYHFRDHRVRHNPEMLKAARALAEAKSHLWYAKGDFGGHRVNAINQINLALDEINAAENDRRGGDH